MVLQDIINIGLTLLLRKYLLMMWHRLFGCFGKNCCNDKTNSQNDYSYNEIEHQNDYTDSQIEYQNDYPNNEIVPDIVPEIACQIPTQFVTNKDTVTARNSKHIVEKNHKRDAVVPQNTNIACTSKGETNIDQIKIENKQYFKEIQNIDDKIKGSAITNQRNVDVLQTMTPQKTSVNKHPPSGCDSLAIIYDDVKKEFVARPVNKISPRNVGSLQDKVPSRETNFKNTNTQNSMLNFVPESPNKTIFPKYDTSMPNTILHKDNTNPENVKATASKQHSNKNNAAKSELKALERLHNPVASKPNVSSYEIPKIDTNCVSIQNTNSVRINEVYNRTTSTGAIDGSINVTTAHSMTTPEAYGRICRDTALHTSEDQNKYYTIDYITNKGTVRKVKVFLMRNWNCIIGKKKCFICMLCKSYVFSRPDLHCDTPNHIQMLNAKNEHFLTEFKDNFICEIKFGTSVQYHCNTCNVELDSIKFIRNHCSNSKHKNQLEKTWDKLVSAGINKRQSVKEVDAVLPIQDLLIKPCDLVTEFNRVVPIYDLLNKTCGLPSRLPSLKQDISIDFDSFCIEYGPIDYRNICLADNNYKEFEIYGSASDLKDSPLLLQMFNKQEDVLHDSESDGYSDDDSIDSDIDEFDNDVFDIEDDLENVRPIQKYVDLFIEKEDVLCFLNGKYSIANQIWNFIVPVDDKLKCWLCSTHVSHASLKSHLTENSSHRNKLNVYEEKILFEFSNDIIRETPVPSHYHCALCNTIMEGLQNVRGHCTLLRHVTNMEEAKNKYKTLKGCQENYSGSTICITKSTSMTPSQRSLAHSKSHVKSSQPQQKPVTLQGTSLQSQRPSTSSSSQAPRLSYQAQATSSRPAPFKTQGTSSQTSNFSQSENTIKYGQQINIPVSNSFDSLNSSFGSNVSSSKSTKQKAKSKKSNDIPSTNQNIHTRTNNKPKLPTNLPSTSTKKPNVSANMITKTVQNFSLVQVVKKGILINTKHLISFKSWNLCVGDADDIFCFLCDEDLYETPWNEHVNRLDHRTKLKACHFLVKYGDNLIRQHNNKEFHCAVCNDVWYSNHLRRHIDSTEHKNNMAIVAENAKEALRQHAKMIEVTL